MELTVFQIDTKNIRSGIRLFNIEVENENDFVKKEEINRSKRKSGKLKFSNFPDCKHELQKLSKLKIAYYKELVETVDEVSVKKCYSKRLKDFRAFSTALHFMKRPRLTNGVIKEDPTYSVMSDTKVIVKEKSIKRN